MGKTLITQKRGKGSSTYTAPSFNYIARVTHRKYDERERTSVTYGRVLDIIHCSGHSAPLIKVRFENGEDLYLFAPEKVRVGDILASGLQAPVERGNTLPLKNIPEGTEVFNLEIMPGDGGKLIRASGCFAKVVGRMGDQIMVTLPSKKQKLFNSECRATIGVPAGGGRKEKPFLKAGTRMFAMRARNKLYPQVSGVAMNAVSHPFGSGRGRHIGKSKIPPRGASPGRNVGLIKARRTGRKR